MAVIMVFKPNAYIRIPRKIFAVKTVGRRRSVSPLHKEVGAIYHPIGIHSRVIWNHVGCKPNAALPEPCAQIGKRIPTADIFGNIVIVKRICGSGGLRVTAKLLDSFRSVRARPKPDEPKSRKAFIAERVQFFVRNQIKPVYRSSIFFCKLVKPHQNRLCHQNYARHPFAVGAEAFVLLHQTVVIIRLHVNISAVYCTCSPEHFFFFGERVESGQKAFE